MLISVAMVATLLVGCATAPEKWQRIDGHPADEGTTRIAVRDC
jgi:hypothetical protein